MDGQAQRQLQRDSSRRGRGRRDRAPRSTPTCARQRLRHAAQAPGGRAARWTQARASRGAARVTFEIEVNGRDAPCIGRASQAGSLPRHRRRRRARWSTRPRVGEYGLSLLLDDAEAIAAASSRETAGCPRRRDGRAARRPRRTDGHRSASTAAAPARRCRRRRRTRDGEQSIVAPMPGRVVRSWSPLAIEVTRAPAGGRGRSDEDGERAALAEGGAGQGGRGRAGRRRSRPGACSS